MKKQSSATKRSGWLRILSSPHFLALVVLFGILVALQYPEQVLRIHSPSAFSFLGLSRHAAERILFLAPIGYAIVAFGTVGGVISLIIAAAAMMPRVFLLSQYWQDALVETVGVILIGAFGTLASRSYRRERKRRQEALSSLDAAYQQVQQHNRTLQVHEQRLAIVNRISNIVSQSLDLSQILDDAVDSIVDLLKTDGVWICLLDEQENELVPSAHRGVTEQDTRIKVGHGLSGRVAETGQALIINNESADARMAGATAERAHSALAVPLRSKGRVNGVLGISSTTDRSFQPGEVGLLSAIGEQIGMAIDNARLFQRQQEVLRRLAASEQRYRQLFESANDAIWVHDLEGNFRAANRATEKMTGYGAEELLPMNVRSFLTPESLSLAGQIRNRLLAGDKQEQPYEQHIIRRDGTGAILKLTTNLLKEDGKPAGFLHIARDVTEEKRMQDELSAAYVALTESHRRLKESQEQLIQAEKLTSLGQLAASIAHEVNNPLSGVLAYDQLLLKQIRSGGLREDKAIDYLSKMEAELVRSTRLIRNLLDFARQSTPTLRPVNLNEVVDRAYNLVAHSAVLRHIQVVKELDPSLPGLTADFDQLQQVFTNLILNAVQAMSEGGTLTLRTWAKGDQVSLEVRDTGCGISPENMARLFTPFFTTKREVKGVGLGLAVSYGIVQRHKGKIEVQSKVGEGTAMIVHLPLLQDESAGEPPADAQRITGQDRKDK